MNKITEQELHESLKEKINNITKTDEKNIINEITNNSKLIRDDIKNITLSNIESMSKIKKDLDDLKNLKSEKPHTKTIYNIANLYKLDIKTNVEEIYSIPKIDNIICDNKDSSILYTITDTSSIDILNATNGKLNKSVKLKYKKSLCNTTYQFGKYLAIVSERDNHSYFYQIYNKETLEVIAYIDGLQIEIDIKNDIAFTEDCIYDLKNKNIIKTFDIQKKYSYIAIDDKFIYMTYCRNNIDIYDRKDYTLKIEKAIDFKNDKIYLMNIIINGEYIYLIAFEDFYGTPICNYVYIYDKDFNLLSNHAGEYSVPCRNYGKYNLNYQLNEITYIANPYLNISLGNLTMDKTMNNWTTKQWDVSLDGYIYKIEGGIDNENYLKKYKCEIEL